MAPDINKFKNILEAVESNLAKHGNLEEIKKLKSSLNGLISSPVSVLVCGEFKRGKSTFINALLGRQLCPTDIDICTSVVSVIKYGKEEKATRFFGEFSNLQREEIPLDELEDYTVGSPEEIGNTVYVEIEMPLPVLESGLAIIDTPGVGGLDPRHAVLTSYFLPRADVTIFMTDVSEPLTATELEFYTKRVLPAARQNIVIVNKADLKTPEEVEDITNDTISKISQATGISAGGLDVIAVSSAAELYPDQGLGESNFGLVRGCISKEASYFVQTSLLYYRDALKEIIGDTLFSINEQISTLESFDEDKEKRLLAMKEAQDKKLEDLSNPSSEFRKKIDTTLAHEKENITSWLNREAIKLQGEFLYKVLDDPRAQSSSTGVQWVGVRINEQLQIIANELTTRLSSVFARIAMLPEFDGMLAFKVVDFKGEIKEQKIFTDMPMHKRLMPLTSVLGIYAVGHLILNGIPVVGNIASLGIAAYVGWKNYTDSSKSFQQSKIIEIYQPQISAAIYDIRIYMESRFNDFQKEWIIVLGDRIKECRNVIVETIENIAQIKKDIARQTQARIMLQSSKKSLEGAVDALGTLEF